MSHSELFTEERRAEGSEAELPQPASASASQQWPLDPKQLGPGTSGRKLGLPSGLELDPWHWTNSQGADQGSRATPGSTVLLQSPGAASLGRPESRAAGSREVSPSARTPGSRHRRGTGEPSGSPLGAGFGPESEEDRMHRLARQRLLAADDLSPQEWARIGLPQDAVDLDKFVAREYDVTVDYDRRTMAAKRVARPDIFHISQDEAQRRQIESDEATLALQAQRRAEAEAEQQAAEEERLARSAARGPKYDVMGVRRQERNVSPVLPRYLDWHPDGVGGFQQQQRPPQQQPFRPQTSGRRSVSGGSGYNTGASSTPHMSRCTSAARTRSESAAAHAYGALRGSSLADQPLGTSRRTDAAAAGVDTYVYDDLSEDPQDNGMGLGAAYGTRPPRRRHHSAMAGPCSFAPPQRPAGMTDAHYAQIVRQQRKWLNGPAQPLRPFSAAPLPPPVKYVRPRSSRPPPEGTAAPSPSRVAAAAAALAAAAAASDRPISALRTIIHQRTMAPPPGRSRVHASWGGPTSAGSTGGNTWSAPGVQGPDGGASSRPQSGAVRPTSAQSAAAAPSHQKRLPWEAREHLAGAAAAGIIPHRLSWEGPDPAGPPSAGWRRSSNGMSATSGAGYGSRPASGLGNAKQQQQRRSSSAYGDAEGAGGGSEAYGARGYNTQNGHTG